MANENLEKARDTSPPPGYRDNVARGNLKDDEGEPFIVGDRAQFVLSESQTPTWKIVEVRCLADKTFYKLEMPNGKIYKDKEGDEWVPQKRLINPKDP